MDVTLEKKQNKNQLRPLACSLPQEESEKHLACSGNKISAGCNAAFVMCLRFILDHSAHQDEINNVRLLIKSRKNVSDEFRIK